MSDYPNEVQQFYYETLGWCGCGNPEDALMFMRDVLAATKARSDTWSDESCKDLDELLPLSGALALSYRYMLDVLKLTEHGGSVYGAWLTDEGKRVLALLQSGEIEELMSDAA